MTFYDNTKEDSRSWVADHATRAQAIDTAAVNAATALGTATPITARENGVAVTPTAPSIAPLGTSQLTATVLSGVKNAGVTWASSNTAVATVNASGLVTGVAAGTANITATSVEHTHKSGFAKVTVA